MAGYNSKYFLDELLAQASKVKDDTQYGGINKEHELKTLAKLDWPTAAPLINSIATPASNALRPSPSHSFINTPSKPETQPPKTNSATSYKRSPPTKTFPAGLATPLSMLYQQLNGPRTVVGVSLITLSVSIWRRAVSFAST